MDKPFVSRTKRSLFLCILLLSLSFPIATARAGNTPVTVSDLDEIIRDLPRRLVVDRISPLVARLKVLNACQTINPERAALSQAIVLIKLMRTIRLSTAPIQPVVSMPLFAYSTGSKASNDCHSDK